MTTFEKHYIKYFTPLIQDFVRDVEALQPAVEVVEVMSRT